jgi:hypothetical protein
MKQEHDADDLDNQAAKHESIANELRLKAQQERDGGVPVSPHTKMPVDHPESQAVERERYLMGISLASATKPEEIQDWLDKQDGK